MDVLHAAMEWNPRRIGSGGGGGEAGKGTPGVHDAWYYRSHAWVARV